jgi:2-iminobutanoate/2-iminopropanoate deaminase
MEVSMKKIIKTENAPKPVGPYSQAVIGAGLIFTAGQIAINPENGELEKDDIRVQTDRVIRNLEAVLKASGSDLNHVLKTTVFLKNMDDFHSMNEVYIKYFSEDSPARSAVEVARLPKNVLVEIECIALRKT